MDPDRYQRLMAEFEAVSEAATETRARAVRRLRAEDAELADQLERMLGAHEGGDPRLDSDSAPSLGALLADTALRSDDGPDELERPAGLGEVIGGYVLESVLGEGGMGCVYRARHEVLGRPAAVKLLAPKLALDNDFVSRFMHEAKIVNEVHSPNIVDIFDFVRVDAPRRVACVMELLEGVPLSRAIAAGPLSVTQTINTCLQVCGALEIVHARGVVHRDLKPDNLFVVGDLEGDLSESPSIKVLDFGIAKVTDGQVAHKTASGAMLGTPVYMAPEQMAAEPVTPATDIYAVGEILYEMLTGARLFASRGVELMSVKLASEGPAIALPDELPGAEALASLIARCVQKVPSRRPSLLELVTGLEAIRAGLPVEAGPRRAGATRASASQVDTAPSGVPEAALGTDLSPGRPRGASGWVAVALAGAALAVGVGLAVRPPSTSTELSVEPATAVPALGVAAGAPAEPVATPTVAVARPPAPDPRPGLESPEHGSGARGGPGPDRPAQHEARDGVEPAAPAPAPRLATPPVRPRRERPRPPGSAPPGRTARAPTPTPVEAAPAPAPTPPPAEAGGGRHEDTTRALVQVDSVPTGAVVQDAATRRALGVTPLAVELTTPTRTVILSSRGFAPARVTLAAGSGQSLVRLVPAIIQTEETRPW